MGVTKKEEFSAEQNRIADLAKALAHPARVAIIQYMAKEKSCLCGDLVDYLPISQATVSQHLKELKNMNIIIGEITPPKVCYCINPEIINELSSIFNKLFISMNKFCTSDEC